MFGGRFGWVEKNQIPQRVNNVNAFRHCSIGRVDPNNSCRGRCCLTRTGESHANAFCLFVQQDVGCFEVFQCLFTTGIAILNGKPQPPQVVLQKFNIRTQLPA